MKVEELDTFDLDLLRASSLEDLKGESLEESKEAKRSIWVKNSSDDLCFEVKEENNIMTTIPNDNEIPDLTKNNGLGESSIEGNLIKN
jgi:hypothetical protein